MSDDEPRPDIVDLAEVRARKIESVRRHDDDDDGTIIAAWGDRVEFRIAYDGGDTETLVTDVATARQFADMFRAAAWQAERNGAEKCIDCGAPKCGQWHVGQRVEGWCKGVKVVAYVAKLTKRSVRLEPVDGSPAFYRGLDGRNGWRIVGRGRLVSVR